MKKMIIGLLSLFVLAGVLPVYASEYWRAEDVQWENLPTDTGIRKIAEGKYEVYFPPIKGEAAENIIKANALIKADAKSYSNCSSELSDCRCLVCFSMCKCYNNC